MIPWNQAYNRLQTDEDFQTLFGKKYRKDDFRYYAYAIKFDAVQPALLAAAAGTPNTGSNAVTQANLGVPINNIVPGVPSQSQINFPAGAVILGMTAAALKLQRVANNGAPQNFTYSPSNEGDEGVSEDGGNRDLFSMSLAYSDGSLITGKNPIPETAVNVDSGVITAPPILCEALLGSGGRDDIIAREIFVTPALGLLVTVRSMVLPDLALAASTLYPPNLAVHIVFHAMVPGIVTAAA